VSFLNQLKTQASALQQKQEVDVAGRDHNVLQTDLAMKTVWNYFSELAKQLDVIAPKGPSLSVDGKTPWPAMQLSEFRVDARKKTLRDKEVADYVAMGWRILPVMGKPVGGSVTANFSTDIERIEAALACGNVKHERIALRDPEKNTLKAVKFEYLTEARGSVMVSAENDEGRLTFRLGNLRGFEVLKLSLSAERVQTHELDELAKLIVGQASDFV
jgi:hypothetical protein